MLYPVDIAAACPLVKTYDIFGIVVVYGLEIAELAVPGSVVRYAEGGLHVDAIVVMKPHEVDLSAVNTSRRCWQRYR